ncbi:hypothetical protein J3R30DRAFT_3401337 [Lentinula aciculospora]|uniref:Uncharacterized protein n=1 Tax=Lentinula aciculospora TaxID=153920 RepID=A0A9W9DUH8_9AGAR|nr:hypothetical protein J3R30DRAFT_3401337 [Lentinula aciculospora]
MESFRALNFVRGYTLPVIAILEEPEDVTIFSIHKMAEPSLDSSRRRSQPSVSRTNTSIRSASTQGHVNAQNPPQPIPMPIPVPSPVQALDPHGKPRRRGIRSYYATNPDPTPETDGSAEEYMNITVADIEGQVMGFNVQPVVVEPIPRRKDGGKRFIGGFVRSLRKIPRTMFRPGHGPSTIEPSAIDPDTLRQPAARGPLPSYMLTPPTPALPVQPISYLQESHVPETPDFLPTTSPHPTRIELDEATLQSPEHNPDRDPNMPPVSRHTSHHTSHHTSQHNNNPSTNRNSFAYPNSYHDPPSVAANPQPSPDYRRMSRNTGEESVLESYSIGTPSFSTELDRNPFRILKALVSMPWVSHDRVTVDYSPGMEDSRGALRMGSPEGKEGRSKGSKDRQSARWSIVEQGWKPWKRTSVFLTLDGRIVSAEEGPDALARGDARKGKMYVPVNKPQTSWYSGGHLIKRSPRTPHSGIPRTRELDLMSSGSEPGVRSSAGSTPRASRVSRVSARRRISRSTVTSPSSPNSPSPIRRPRNRETYRQTPRRQSRRLYYSNNEYAFLDPGSTPGSSPILARRSNMKMRPREVHRDRTSNDIRRRYNRDISRHARQPQPFVPPMPPLPPPASPYPLSPLVFVQSTHMDSPAGGVDHQSHPQTGSGVPVPVYGVTPMYMSILPGMPPPPAAANGIGESSPPGFAGRGAGGGYGPGYGVQGYPGTAAPGGAYSYSYAYPYPPSQSPPPQNHPHDSDTRKAPLHTTG